MVTKKEFGKMADGRVVNLYSISNSRGFQADVMNYGAILVNLFVTDKNGDKKDVVLGYDNLEDYFENACFFGATVAPSCNRIKGAKFELDGVTYHLDVNENDNNLHSHREKGLHKAFWETETTEDSVTFTCFAPDGEIGFPGNRTFHVTYTVTEENELCIHYAADSDKLTMINMTSHSYFNLAGHESGYIGAERIRIKADQYLELEPDSVPSGKYLDVEGTPMDLREFTVINDHIDDDFEQLKLAHGYDHNYVLCKETDGVEEIAEVVDDKTGIRMTVSTDLPGVQFYTANFITTHTGKNGATYADRYALCLETQYYPNAINEPKFPQPVFGPDKPYAATTVFKFDTV